MRISDILGDRRPILHAAAGVEHLRLGHDGTRQVGSHPMKTNERGVTHEVEYGIRYLHGPSLPR